MLREFPIYDAPNLPDYGTRTARIEVGRWGTIYPASGRGHVFKGKIIVAYGRIGQEIYRETLRGHSRWEANERNTLGTMGAVRFDPPTAEEVEAAIERARRSLVAEANLLEAAPPLRSGWSDWEYIPPQVPFPNEPETKRGTITTFMSVVDDPTGEGYRVTGAGSFWKATTDSLTPGGQCIFYSNKTYSTAGAAMIACEKAATEPLVLS